MKPFLRKPFCVGVYLSIGPHFLYTVKMLRVHFISPDTSRPSRPGEIHGKDYFFESREQMQIDIEAGKFIEHGEFRGNLYGTSVDGIRDFIHAGYQPVVSPHYQVKPQTSGL